MPELFEHTDQTETDHFMEADFSAYYPTITTVVLFVVVSFLSPELRPWLVDLCIVASAGAIIFYVVPTVRRIRWLLYYNDLKRLKEEHAKRKMTK